MEPQATAPLDVIRVGPSVNLIQINAAAKDFGISAANFRDLLETMQIPSLTVGSRDYFNLFALERGLFVYLQEAGRAPQTDEQLLLEMSIAGLTYAVATKEALRARLAKLAETIRKNCAVSHHKKS